MTREEATQIMSTWLVSSKGAKGQRGYIEGWFDEEDAEAFRMAIEALQADAVSLTGTMKYLIKPHNYCEVVRCKDCKHGEEDYPQRIREQMDERWKDTPQTYSCKHSTYSHDGEFFCGYGERREP